MAKAYSYNALEDAGYVYTVASGVASANRAGATTFDYFVNSPAVGDAVYFSRTFGRPCHGVQLYVGTPMNGTPTFVWEFNTGSNGQSWQALPGVANADAMTKAGLQLVTWTMPELWRMREGAPHTGMANYTHWVRCRLTGIAGVTEGGAQSTQAVRVGSNTIVATGGTSGDPLCPYDLYEAAVAGGWGVATRLLALAAGTNALYTRPVYMFNCSVEVGDGVIADYFQSYRTASYLWTYEQGAVVTTANGGQYWLFRLCTINIGGANHPCYFHLGEHSALQGEATSFTSGTCTWNVVNSILVLASRERTYGFDTMGGTGNLEDVILVTELSEPVPALNGTCERVTLLRGTGNVRSTPTTAGTLYVKNYTSWVHSSGSLYQRKHAAGTTNKHQNNVWAGQLELRDCDGWTAFGFGSSLYHTRMTKTLAVTVLGSTGAVLPGAAVVIKDSTGATVYTGTTDVNGLVTTPLVWFYMWHVFGAPPETKYYPADADIRTPHTVTITAVGYADRTLTLTMDQTRVEVEQMSTPVYVPQLVPYDPALAMDLAAQGLALDVTAQGMVLDVGGQGVALDVAAQGVVLDLAPQAVESEVA